MKPFPNNRLTPDEILDATYAAADAILEVYHQREEIVAQTKKDNSPVTEADLRAHHILNDVLLRSGWPVMSEEGQHAAFADRRDWEYYWVVDPLDGTKEFIKGNGEFTINIALVQGQTPIFGVVYSPVLNWLFETGTAEDTSLTRTPTPAGKAGAPWPSAGEPLRLRSARKASSSVISSPR